MVFHASIARLAQLGFLAAVLPVGCGDNAGNTPGHDTADQGHGGSASGGSASGGSASGGSGQAGSANAGGGAAGQPDTGARDGWPVANEYSWNGSWTPTFPVEGLYDEKYFDGHSGTPLLPPGDWDYEDQNSDLANYRNFRRKVGELVELKDGQGRAYGWEVLAEPADGAEIDAQMAFYEGSPGADWFDLGPAGYIHSTHGNLADGPDVLVFDRSRSLDLRTGSELSGAVADDDLVVAGCGENPDGAFEILTTTIHTGPGSDWVFIRDWSRAAVDLGMGQGGRTDATDPEDGDDLAVMRGNAHDFRFMGGYGNDTAFWYVDDVVQTERWLGPAFFGGGAAGDALWDDPGIDRLVMVVPDDTLVVDRTPTPNGAFMARWSSGELILDGPTQYDPYAAYCSECGESPDGRRTMVFEYNRKDGNVNTGYFYVTGFEEVQLGLGEGARVYRINDRDGTIALAEDLTAAEPPPFPSEFCE